MNKNELISIIIPVFNGERFLSECLDSILNQTYKKFEIIIINDGSTDSTQSIINQYKKRYDCIFDYYQKNSGQGVARNKGLNYSKGEFVAFIDADDLIHEEFLEKLYNSIKKHNSDFAICDWMYYINKEKNRYVNKNKFISSSLLENEDTELILSSNIYFTVNKLYKKRFLIKNNIKYGEGYIYEDYEFYIKSCVLANKVSVVSNPHYFVRVNEYSTTKTNYDNMVHYESFLKAIDASLHNLKLKNKYSLYYIYRYFLTRTFVYFKNRIPKNKRKMFVKDTFKNLNKYNSNILVPKNIRIKNSLIFNDYLINYKINNFILINNLTRLKVVKWLKNIFALFNKNIFKTMDNIIKHFYYKIQLKLPIYNDVVFFYGFDRQYIGNSKYLYESFLNEKINKKLYFVTNSNELNPKFQVTFNTFKFWRLLARSKNLIYESWVPTNFIKRTQTNWIQLWHGTPIKKMLFDSTEFNISMKNHYHKLNKFKDIQKWDYLICENINIKSKFKNSFLIKSQKLLAYGYPRVKYLTDNINNKNKINQIKKGLNIPYNKKIIFYAPTWRDYNYNNKSQDLNYLLNLNKLKEKISDEYIIIQKEHPFLKGNKNIKGVININNEIETQDILLISDLLISDYSSIIFDFINIEKPFIIYSNYFLKYEKSRGVYFDIWNDINFVNCKNISEIINLIKLIEKNKYDYKKLLYLKNKYCCLNIEYCYNNIKKLLK